MRKKTLTHKLSKNEYADYLRKYIDMIPEQSDIQYY